jgi:hypothetical protein
MQLVTAQWVVVSGVELRPFALHLINLTIRLQVSSSAFTSFVIITFTTFDVSLLQFKVQGVQILFFHTLFGGQSRTVTVGAHVRV